MTCLLSVLATDDRCSKWCCCEKEKVKDAKVSSPGAKLGEARTLHISFIYIYLYI